ncbi:MAG: S1C family serine protease [Rhodospirillales bacterium]|nr:S1C family serine protease [Rhodospirillales bacterium]
MIEDGDWEFEKSAQPKPGDFTFDLDRTLSSVVSVHSKIPDDAFTATFLGTERQGNGVIINDSGLVLTIGYLVTEAEQVWLISEDQLAVPAHVVGFDQETGFGLVQALGRMDLPAIKCGSVTTASVNDEVIIAGAGGRRHSLKARIMAMQEFAGYWEYALNLAIFTAPPHPLWGGAALISGDGDLLGIGSLFLQNATEGGAPGNGNMFVPIDLLEPILEDILKFGKPNKPPRPWLGIYTAEAEGNLIVTGLAANAPAERGGVRVGDVLKKVSGEPITSQIEFYRDIWSLGPAETTIPLTVLRGGENLFLEVRSGDRNDFLISPKLH